MDSHKRHRNTQEGGQASLKRPRISKNRFDDVSVFCLQIIFFYANYPQVLRNVCKRFRFIIEDPSSRIIHSHLGYSVTENPITNTLDTFPIQASFKTYTINDVVFDHLRYILGYANNAWNTSLVSKKFRKATQERLFFDIPVPGVLRYIWVALEGMKNNIFPDIRLYSNFFKRSFFKLSMEDGIIYSRYSSSLHAAPEVLDGLTCITSLVVYIMTHLDVKKGCSIVLDYYDSNIESIKETIMQHGGPHSPEWSFYINKNDVVENIDELRERVINSIYRIFPHNVIFNVHSIEQWSNIVAIPYAYCMKF